MTPSTQDERGDAAGAMCALVAAVLGGDADAFDAWFRAEHPRVHRLCVGFLADGAEADDVAQDAMIHIHDKLGAWDRGRPYDGWRNTLVLNLCRDRQRRRAARARAEEAAEWLPARLPQPDDEAARGEVRAIIVGALGALTEREREAFVLRDLEGRPTDEVAAVLGVRESSVRSLLTLARRRLRDLLAERLPEGRA